MIDQIRRWTEMAEKHLAPLDVPLYWIGGNDDKSEALLQAESTPHVHFIDEKVVRFDEDHEILGFGWTNPSPWRTPRELSEEGLKRRLDPLLSRVEDPARCIYLMHAPPYGTGLDIAPKLDATTDPPCPEVQVNADALQVGSAHEVVYGPADEDREHDEERFHSVKPGRQVRDAEERLDDV